MNNSGNTRLKPSLFAATAAISLILLSACGQRGALYLPTEEQKAQQQKTAAKDAEKEQTQQPIKSQN